MYCILPSQHSTCETCIFAQDIPYNVLAFTGVALAREITVYIKNVMVPARENTALLVISWEVVLHESTVYTLHSTNIWGNCVVT